MTTEAELVTLLGILCPVMMGQVSQAERTALLHLISAVYQEGQQVQEQLDVLKHVSIRDRDLLVKVRDVLLQYASYIPEAAEHAEDDAEVGIKLPGRLARPLYSMGVTETLANVVRELSQKQAAKVPLGYLYPNRVLAHNLSMTGKALHVEDLDTGERMWIALSQIVTMASEVTKPGDIGRLVVTQWLAKEKGWSDGDT